MSASGRILTLAKLAANVPSLPGLTGPGSATLIPTNPHGTDGRLQRLTAIRAKIQKSQGPRALAPRIASPSP